MGIVAKEASNLSNEMSLSRVSMVGHSIEKKHINNVIPRSLNAFTTLLHTYRDSALKTKKNSAHSASPIFLTRVAFWLPLKCN